MDVFHAPRNNRGAFNTNSYYLLSTIVGDDFSDDSFFSPKNMSKLVVKHLTLNYRSDNMSPQIATYVSQ